MHTYAYMHTARLPTHAHCLPAYTGGEGGKGAGGGEGGKGALS